MWDLQGQDRVVTGINKLFCKGASGALVLADITDIGSIENTANWKNKVNEFVLQYQRDHDKNGMLDQDEESPGIPMILVLNKYDLVENFAEEGNQLEEFMTQDFLQSFAEENGFIGAICTSAKTGVGVTEAVGVLVR